MEIVTGIKPPGKYMDGDIWKRAELPLGVQTSKSTSTEENDLLIGLKTKDNIRSVWCFTV